ncbi:hypothetical protein WJX72_000602 [[Myrmecia] bisecta]|uniref:Uncharacterized protein n=1 Tax=[Myrmecia] bisecta TaxID=41462 RepID=A0AAW1Q2Q3_9CHLO
MRPTGARLGLIRMVKDLYRDATSFGNSELELLKRQAQELQQELAQIDEMRREREKAEEVLALAKLREAVANIQQVTDAHKLQEQLVAKKLEEGTQEAERKLAEELEAKAVRILQALDLEKAMDPTTDLEEVVRRAALEASTSESRGQADGPDDMPEARQSQPEAISGSFSGSQRRNYGTWVTAFAALGG